MTAYAQLLSLLNRNELLHPLAEDPARDRLATTGYVQDYCTAAVQNVSSTGLPPQIDGGTF